MQWKELKAFILNIIRNILLLLLYIIVLINLHKQNVQE
jgi:hypothetical protein